MSTTAAQNAIHQQIAAEARTAITNAAIVGAARRGELGETAEEKRERQVLALSEAYKVLRAKNSAHCPAIKQAAHAGQWDVARLLIEQAEREQIGGR